MEITDLTKIGLSQQQASVYDLLITKGALKPTEVAKQLELSRTNAYKVLDSLVTLKLISKIQLQKTITYQPKNPIALANLTASFRAEAVAREETASRIIQDMLASFSEHTLKPGIELFIGKKKVADAYRKQISLREDIHFIHTKADIPMMGWDTMHEIRVAPSRHGKQRRAILTFPEDGQVNAETHKRSNLEITWAKDGQYNEPVEWSVTKSSLLIVSYSQEPQAILITDKTIAAAFENIWGLLNGYMAKEQPI